MNKKDKTYRDNGAVGALLDEYEKALEELIELIARISEKELTYIVDAETKDPNCHSIQSILSHVVNAGHWYVFEIRQSRGDESPLYQMESSDSIAVYQKALRAMFEANVQLFNDHPNIPLESFKPTEKIRVRWGQHYDVEQLVEHAIVHILRHRRQIERFLIKIGA